MSSFMKKLFKFIPEVEAPVEKPTLNTRLKWTLLVLVTFFVLGSIRVFGLSSAAAGRLANIQVILASSIGTILTVGIGPIVVASIILQLLVGSGILKWDFSNPEDRNTFSNWQKILTIILSFFEAYIYTALGMLAPQPGMFFWVVLQVALGSIILMYLDEVVQKYGIGSGISLFIAGGVAARVFWIIFTPVASTGLGLKIFSTGAAFNLTTAGGYLWQFFNTLGNSIVNATITYIIPIISAFK